MIRTLVGAGLVCLAIGIADAQACAVAPIYGGEAASSRMLVRAGKRCGIMLFAPGGGAIDRVAIVQRPSHGQALVDGSRVIYAARAGYKGGDAFAYTRHYRDMGNNLRVRTVRIAVAVR